MDHAAREITALLASWGRGDEAAERELLERVYPHLRAIAANRLRGERPGQTLLTTDLVHEAFVKMLGQRAVDWQGRAHFFAIAARLMRRILVDRQRRRQRLKRGGDAVRVTLDERAELAVDPTTDWLVLHQALEALGTIDASAEQVVELRFFGGLTHDEIAEVLGTSLATAERRWRFARAWLAHHLADPAV